MSSLADYYCILGFQSIDSFRLFKALLQDSVLKDSLRAFMRLHGMQVQATSHLNARAIDEQAQRAGSNTIWQVHVQNILTARQCATDDHYPIRSDEPQQTFHEHVFVCRNGTSNYPFRARQVCIAASRNCCYQPRLSLGCGPQTISVDQTRSQPIRIASAQ